MPTPEETYKDFVSSNYYRYPLCIPRRFEAPLDSMGRAIQFFESLAFRRTPYGWECMACAESGREWFGSDKEAHAEAHQMGLDYAVRLLRKNPELL